VQQTNVPLADLVRLEDPDFYLGDPFPVFARMRREAPLFWYEPLRLWAATTYDDIRHVSRLPQQFCSSKGVLLNDAKYDGSAMSSFFPDGAEVITLTDPPRHRELRRAIQPAFSPRAAARLEPLIRAKCVELLDALPTDREIDWVDRFASVYPLHVITFMLGLELPIEQLQTWSAQTQRMKDVVSHDELVAAADALRPMHEYLLAEIRDRRQHPRDDLITAFAEATPDGQPMSETNLVTLCQAVLVGANDTTRNLLSNSIWAFATHPQQYRKVVDDPALAASAVEECLRWVGPVPAFMRTVTEDTELGGQPVRAGERIYLLYMAANRDPAAFADPETFDVSRPTDTTHLAFGFGEHMCPGASLARLEMRIAFEELAVRFEGFELAGEAARHVTVQAYGWDRLGVVLRPRSDRPHAVRAGSSTLA
jgi:cytochrome P450